MISQKRNYVNSFDPENHIYRSESSRLPGATDVIKAENMISLDWMSEEAMWRGKCVHRAIELLNKNLLDWDSLDREIWGYVMSYKEFLSQTKFQLVGSEEPCFAGSYACIPDVWGVMNKFNCVVELKTGMVPKWAKIQTALQVRALRTDKGFSAIKRFGLRLMKDGTISKLEPFEDSADDRAAMSMVESFHFKLNNGYIKNWRNQ